MTDEQIERQIEVLKKATKDASKSKETAIKFLREAGIPVGNEPFGDKKKKDRHA